MTVALALLRKYWKPLAVLIALLLIWLHGDRHGTQQERTKWELLTARQSATAARAIAKAESDARRQEQEWAAAMDATASLLIEENRNVAAHRDRLLAAARAGRLRLPSCPASMPEAPAGSAGRDASSGGGIPGAAGVAFTEFLIAEAARADQIAAQLAACQEAHRAIR